jgi:RNA polymerase sigma-70 factor (ECF subfamily)
MRGVPEREDRVLGELVWLEPCPDRLLEGLADRAPGPEARYEPAEAISLAFVTALQLLPPGQRAVLILRDVLGFRATEAAGILDVSVESVTGALERARTALQRRLPTSAGREPPPPPGSAAEQAIIAQLTRAFETGNVDQLVALLTDDVWVTVPPVALEYRGREPAARFFAAVSFRQGRTYRLIPTRANGQPAFGAYARDPQAKIAHADGLLAVTLSGGRICAMARFSNSVLPRFGLPRTLPG